MKLVETSIVWGVFAATCNLVLATPTPAPRPLVIWHGLGDSAHSKGMVDFIEAIQEKHPGLFVHSVFIDENEDDDRKAGFFGNLDVQLPLVYEQLNAIPELANGFDAIGFSQAGQFFRAYVQLYNSPPMHNLITFGSQHMGVSELPACGTYDLLCHLFHRYARGRVYTDWAQANLVPAQYFRDPAKLAMYYEKNHWLPTINNELPDKRNETFAKRFTSLENLVLVVFSNDTTVVPKESGWFGSFAPSEEDAKDDPPPIVHMRDQPLYKEDWIGLRALDERGGVVQVVCEGRHMHISRECWEPLVEKYVGGLVSPGVMPPGLVIQE
ncbi:hypothetical protein FRB99_001661 [Tulasnella sp. 403]|nr:hypothetical protein FRB99_001661 [Tulasnella sp. 403]